MLLSLATQSGVVQNLTCRTPIRVCGSQIGEVVFGEGTLGLVLFGTLASLLYFFIRAQREVPWCLTGTGESHRQQVSRGASSLQPPPP